MIKPESEHLEFIQRIQLIIKKNWPILSLLLILLIVFAILIYLVVPMPDPNNDAFNNNKLCSSLHETYSDTSTNKSILSIYKHFSVAVDNAYCSTVGKNILSLNGSAVDAAIAAALCNGIANSQSAGIGGGHFMLIYLREKKTFYSIDARETAPMSTNKWTFSRADIKSSSSLVGGLATGIPGEIEGFWRAHQLAGRLSWEVLFQPSIQMCRNGFKVSRVLANSMKRSETFIRNSVELSHIFINKLTNETWKENDYIKMVKLADTLELISKTNIAEFYNGNLTQTMVNEINENGGSVTLQDFNNYRALIKSPISLNIDSENRLYTVPPPSSGILIPFIMRVMRGFILPKKNLFENLKQSSLFYHRLIETFKHAFASRSLLGDENYEEIDSVLKQLSDDNFINEIRSKIIDNRTFSFDYYENKFLNRFDHGTAHLSVLAENGDAVSLTQTINLHFGAKYVGKNSGIIYNNQMDDFSQPNSVNYFGLKPSEPNFIKGGKRPMSSMCPIIIVDKNENVRLILGASGGSKIITAVAQVAIKSLWMTMNMKEAIDEPRVHHQLYPKNKVELEEGFNKGTQMLLASYGHDFECFSFGGSVVQGIKVKPNGLIESNCDSRKGGLPDGV